MHIAKRPVEPFFSFATTAMSLWTSLILKLCVLPKIVKSGCESPSLRYTCMTVWRQGGGGPRVFRGGIQKHKRELGATRNGKGL